MAGQQKCSDKNAAPYCTFTGLTRLHSLRGRASPCWELSDEVVAHVQNFQFLSFPQPVWQRLHMVPAEGEWVIVMKDYVPFVKRET